MYSLAKTYVDEVVGGDGVRRYNLIGSDGSAALSNVQIVKAYTPSQEGTQFGAADVYNLQSRTVSATVSASAWSGTTPPYTAKVTVSGMTATDNAIVGLAPTATQDQRSVCRKAQITPTAQASNSITLTADGALPNIALPIIVTILEVK